MKKWIMAIVEGILIALVASGLMAAVVAAAVVGAAGGPMTPDQNTAITTITVISDDIQVQIENPFKVRIGTMSVNIGNGKIFAGEKIASVPVTITNVGRIPYGLSLSVHPMNVSGSSWPYFETHCVVNQTTYYPGQMTIGPGETISMEVEITVSYSSPLVFFRGLVIEIWPAPAQIPAFSDGCG